MSQNVWNSFFAGGPDRFARLRALHEFLERHAVDVVVTQEMFVLGLGPLVDQSDADAAAESMSSLGFKYQTMARATLPTFGQSSGLVVYSKLPITQETHNVFAARRSVSCKGWLEVELELGPPSSNGSVSRMVLMDTHLEHAHEPRWRAVREQQWRQIAASAADAVRRLPGRPLVAVFGDFNICSDAVGQHLDGGTEYEALRSALANAGLPCDLVRSPDLPTLRPPPANENIRCSVDHVFVSAALEEQGASAHVVDTRGQGGLAVSDHRGVLVELWL